MSNAGVFSPEPYHILSYGTVLGTTIWHSFVGGIVMFKTLERPQFSAVQSKLFPIYFSLQTAAPAVLAITHPGNTSLLSLDGLLSSANKWTALAPIATMFTSALVNLVVLLPATTDVMAKRRLQEKKDGKKSYDPKPHSQEMIELNKKFGKLHGISSLLNLTTFIATVVYGFHLGGRLR